jgi:hypothetical protein
MRQLTAKQQRLLKEQFKKNKIETVDELYPKVYDAIYNLNPHETFWQNADRFLSDLVFEDLRNRNPFEYGS